MTKTELVATEIREVLAEFARSHHLFPTAIRVDITQVLRTSGGYVIGIDITNNRRESEQFLLTVQYFGKEANVR